MLSNEEYFINKKILEGGGKLSSQTKKEMKEYEKNQALENAGISSLEMFKRKFGKDIEMKYANDVSFISNEYIDSGNYMFNAQMSGDWKKGYPLNKTVVLAGISSSGRTFMAVEAMKNAIKQGYYVLVFDSEKAHDGNSLKSKGFTDEDLTKILHVEFHELEQLNSLLLNFITDKHQDDKVLIVIDSLSMGASRKEVEDIKSENDKADMTRAKCCKTIFRTVQSRLKNCSLIVITHVYKDISAYVQKNVVSGGTGTVYAATNVFDFGSKQIKDKENNKIGRYIVAETLKSRTSKEFKKVAFGIYFDEGLKVESGLVEFFKENKTILEKKNNKFEISKKVLDKYPQLPLEFTLQEYGKNKGIWKDLLEKGLGGVINKEFEFGNNNTEVEEFNPDEQYVVSEELPLSEEDIQEYKEENKPQKGRKKK